MAGFAMTQVAGWSSEDMDGRLELILSTPVSRVRIVIERAIMLAVGTLILAVVSGFAVGIEAHYQSIQLNGPRLIEASLLLVPFTLVYGAIGSLLASHRPRATVGLLAAIAFASDVEVQLEP